MVKITCSYCNKEYASRRSLANHIHKYHSAENDIINTNIDDENNDDNPKCITNVSKMYHQKNSNEIKLFKCKYCGNEYTKSQNRSRHYKTCEKKAEHKREKAIYDFLNKQLYEMTLKLDEQKKEIRRLKRQRFNNNQTVNNNTTNTNSHNTTNNTQNNHINNGTINNINIVAFGNENIPNVIPNDKQIEILNRGSDSLMYLIKYVHFNPDHPEFQNVRITNMRSKVGEVYDQKYNKFIKKPKIDIIEDVKSERTYDIENFAEYNGTNMDANKLNNITQFIDRLYEDKSFNKKYNSQIECLLYNGVA